MEEAVFLVGAAIILVGALGVVFSRNPVHAALFLIQTLFGVAVLFLIVEAHFLAAIQVIVYAGAIVILFLFVIMLLGVDRAENLRVEPIIAQRQLGWLTGAALLGLLLAVINSVDGLSGREVIDSFGGRRAPIDRDTPDVEQLAETIFTDYVFAFEVTGLLLTVAVVGAVVMARKIKGELQPLPELPERRLSRAASAQSRSERAGADDPTTDGDEDQDEDEDES